MIITLITIAPAARDPFLSRALAQSQPGIQKQRDLILYLYTYQKIKKIETTTPIYLPPHDGCRSSNKKINILIITIAPVARDPFLSRALAR